MKYYLTLLSITAFLIFPVSQTSWSQVVGIDGIWYSGEEPVTVELIDEGWRFSVTNESGQKAIGKAFNDEVIYLPSENITGQIEFDTTIIEWSDGTYWAREPFTGEVPPGLPE